jgi:4-amino-4-deoxy-L-arabinose transferase-like glycosyltransferase
MDSTRASTRLVMVLLLLAAGLIGLRGMASLPPDEHEILVLRTAHEMHARGDWIVPYFNDEPRLKKPPLSYWLTGLAAALSGADGQVVAWHGRLPSWLAGLAMLAMLLSLGRRFYGERAALYAAAMFVGSVGFFTYSHDGRPDFLYAALCTAGWMTGALALVEGEGRRTRPIVLMWLAFALATLAKGPHIPFMLLVAMAIYCLTRQPRMSPGVLRPLLGVVLVAIVTLPWWLALHARIDPTAVRGSQLAGRLLVPRMNHLFNGYYLYRPLQLLLPWVPLAPLAWWAALRRGHAARPFTVYLVFAAGAVAFGLSLGVQQRFFYMLPVMLALCLLAGHGLARLDEEQPRVARALTLVQALMVAGGAAWLCWAEHELTYLLLILAVALGVAMLAARSFASRTVGAVLAVLVLTTGIFARHADGHVLWSVARFHRHALAAETARQVGAHQPLFSYALTPVLYIQVTGRAIPEFQTVNALERAMDARQLREAWVLAPVKRRAELAQRFTLRELAIMPRKANDRAGLFLISRQRQ